ncbi:hypothetical protein C8Q77DRAFT_1155656 [Trametes polyzona]|nr:hypothetical protein C8Q77DRAFT_1155656 [Trametes polyzona]
MKFTAAILTSVLAASALVSAAPLDRRAGKTKMMAQTTRFDAAGAVYFITNEPDENMVIAASINADGTLNLDRAVAAGGRGAHGGADGPDPLFSQGAIKASAKGKVLATVNPGSNTVALFSIDPNTPTNINSIGDVVSSEGEFPMSLAFNDAGDRLCVLNGGTVNGVICYKVDKKVGLTAIPNTLRSLGLNQTTPATGPAGTASHIVFSEDGKQLIASVKGVPPTPGFLAVWDVKSDGTLSPEFKKLAPAKKGLLPFSMTVIPGKNAILATDAGLGFDIFDLKDNNKSSAIGIDGQVATCWSSFSKRTGNFYLTDIGTATVTEVHVDDNLKGSIVRQYPQVPGSATIDNDIANVNGMDYLYVLAPNATAVDVLLLDAPGSAKKVSTLDISGPTKAAGITINPNNLQGMTTFVR